MTQAAETASAIRKELKAKYPTIKFGVRSENYAGGNAVRISWIDGPSYDDVREICGKYQYGHFDGMCDIYEHSNSRSDIPQAKYVQYTREFSVEKFSVRAKEIFKAFGLGEPEITDHNGKWPALKNPVMIGNEWADGFVRRHIDSPEYK